METIKEMEIRQIIEKMNLTFHPAMVLYNMLNDNESNQMERLKRAEWHLKCEISRHMEKQVKETYE